MHGSLTRKQLNMNLGKRIWRRQELVLPRAVGPSMLGTYWTHVALVLAVVPLVAMAVANGIFELDTKPHLCALLAFAFVMHLWIRPGWREICGAVAAGAIFLLCYGRPHSPFGAVFTLITYAGLLGLGSMAVLAVQAQRTKGEERNTRRSALAASLISPIAMILVGFPLRLSAVMHPLTYDNLLYAFDQSMGFQASYLVGRAFAACVPLRTLCAIVYDTLPLAVTLFYPALMIQHKRFRVNVVLLFSGALLIGSLLYNLCPVTGPIYAFPGTFPYHPPQPGGFPLAPQMVAAAARNGMPSLHVGLALLILWNAGVWGRKGKILAGIYLLLTVLATLGLGEHYAVDLVVAVPFSLAMQAAFTTQVPLWQRSRRDPLLAGIVVTAIWLVLLRTSPALFAKSLLLPWGAILVTFIICFAGKRRLDSGCADVCGAHPDGSHEAMIRHPAGKVAALVS